MTPDLSTAYSLIQNLNDPAAIPAAGILSRTVFTDERLKAVLFGFAQGEELSEHTASVPAAIHILQGEARLTLGADSIAGAAGTWIHMAAGLPHSLYATTPVIMLLLMFKD